MLQDGKPATRAKNKYRDKTYDRMELVVPKGKKADLQAHADSKGESLNGFVNRAIDETVERDKALDAFTVQPKEGANAQA